MSKQYFKIQLRYDSGEGPTQESIIYCTQNNSLDYRQFFEPNGDYVQCAGSDSYCEFLGDALKLKQHINNYCSDDWWGCVITEISYIELPEAIKIQT